MAATACAPPATNTRLMPSRSAIINTAGSARPSAPGGVASTTWRHPASRAGTPSMIAVDGSGALPAGTYNPTASSARHWAWQVTPGAVSVL